ncbi:MAG: anaerobic ribonucleoside-triphosphate reductase activating protein [Chitinispirillaceae bacterium]|nr:anaerobic ribonucleoside-triphosphate reductase activating protein [Chitinispirillaceae bacterium]
MHNERVGICAWQKNSFVDFPGTVSSVLFFEGCNLQCPWCHNPQIVKRQLPAVSLDDVLDFMRKRKGLIEGVVLSGGEPTLHASLGPVVEKLKHIDLKVKIDTNGLHPEILQEVEFDYLALDIKTLPSKYVLLGCTLKDCDARLKRSIEMVRARGDYGEIRIPCASGYIDREIALEIAQLVKGVARVFLQPLNYKVEFLDEEYKQTARLPHEKLEEFRSIIAAEVGECKIRGT